MTNTNQPTSLGTAAADGQALAGEVVARNFDGWGPELTDEFEANAGNLDVGGRLLSETETLKVWEIRLNPGQRLPAHRHVLDYFWTAISAGTSRQHTDDGSTRIVHYTPGQTRHFTFGPGEYLLHDLENHGDSPLTFITVEHKPCRRHSEEGTVRWVGAPWAVRPVALDAATRDAEELLRRRSGLPALD